MMGVNWFENVSSVFYHKIEVQKRKKLSKRKRVCFNCHESVGADSTVRSSEVVVCVQDYILRSPFDFYSCVECEERFLLKKNCEVVEYAT